MNKILVYADSPTVATGFGTVTRHVLKALGDTGKYEIDIFGINYHGVPHNAPFNIWPAMDPQENDPYGRKKFCYFAMQHDFDILWILQDTFIVDFIPELLQHLEQEVVKGTRKPFRVIVYYPTDSIIKEKWASNIAPANKLISYTEFGKKELGKHTNVDDVGVIYHGVSTADFMPLPKADVEVFRSNYFGIHSDKFIFMNVNRNQQRKDIPRTIASFKQFKSKNPESVLYLHMARVDQGWNIESLCQSYGLSVTDDVILPENMEPNQGYPKDVLNMLYNCVDCVVSTTLGEGFGLGWVEAMACKTPVIMPDNTAMSELITDDIGYLVECGSNKSLWTCIPNDNEVLRPLVDVDSMVKVMQHVYDNYEEAEEKADKAYKWVTSELSWSGNIARQWQNVFKEELKKLLVKPVKYTHTDTDKVLEVETL